MIDIQNLKNNLPETIENLSRRGFEFNEDYWLKTEEKRKKLQIETEQLQEIKNNLAREIGKLQKEKKDCSKAKEEASKFSDDLKIKKNKLDKVQAELQDFLLSIPNLIDAKVPEGNSESDNTIVEEIGKKPEFNFDIKDHQALGLLGDGMDFDGASKISKSLK